MKLKEFSISVKPSKSFNSAGIDETYTVEEGDTIKSVEEFRLTRFKAIIDECYKQVSSLADIKTQDVVKSVSKGNFPTEVKNKIDLPISKQKQNQQALVNEQFDPKPSLNDIDL